MGDHTDVIAGDLVEVDTTIACANPDRQRGWQLARVTETNKEIVRVHFVDEGYVRDCGFTPAGSRGDRWVGIRNVRELHALQGNE